MRKFFVLTTILFCSISLYQCSPKTAKLATIEPVFSKDQIDQLFDAETLAQGRQIMLNSCANCHKVYEPEEFNPQDWNKILKRMIPYTRLSYDDARLMRAYILKNASES